MKKKLIEAIKAKFVGIDENTAKRLAERAIAKSEAITNDDEVAAAVKAITLSDVLKSVTDFSADEAVKRYEEKYNLEKGEKKSSPEGNDDGNKPNEPAKPQPKPAPQQEGGEKKADPMEEFKTMFADFQKQFSTQLKGISEEVASIKSGNLSESRKAKLNALIKDLKDYQKRPYGRIAVEKMTDEEFDSFLADVKEEVNEIVAESKASGAVVTPALGGTHLPSGPVKEATDKEIDNLMGKFGLDTK